MSGKNYIAIKDNVCVVTNDPNDKDIPKGARAAPINDFTVSDYERLQRYGVNDFTFNQSSGIQEKGCMRTAIRTIVIMVMGLIAGYVLSQVIIGLILR